MNRALREEVLALLIKNVDREDKIEFIADVISRANEMIANSGKKKQELLADCWGRGLLTDQTITMLREFGYDVSVEVVLETFLMLDEEMAKYFDERFKEK